MIDLASSVLTPRRNVIIYWVTTALVVFELTMGGAWDLLRVPQVRGLIERLGSSLLPDHPGHVETARCCGLGHSEVSPTEGMGLCRCVL